MARPAVEAGEKLGFLPGDLKDKVDPFLRPIYDALYDMMPFDQVEKKINNGIIEIAPIAFMRGRTLENCFVILDEAQNVSPMQIKTLMTRISENCKMIIQGDMSQCDKYKTNGVTNYEKSGFFDAWFRLKDLEGVAHMAFTREDCIRHPLVKRILKTYEDEHEIVL